MQKLGDGDFSYLAQYLHLIGLHARFYTCKKLEVGFSTQFSYLWITDQIKYKQVAQQVKVFGYEPHIY